VGTRSLDQHFHVIHDDAYLPLERDVRQRRDRLSFGARE
jgi:hypothetical protein